MSTMRLLLLLICLLLLLPLFEADKSENRVDKNKDTGNNDDEDDDDGEDDDEDALGTEDLDDEEVSDDEAEDADRSKEEESTKKQQSKKTTSRPRSKTKKKKGRRRMGVSRPPITLRSWNMRPPPQIPMRNQQPILLLNLPGPAPVYVNPQSGGRHHNPLFNISSPNSVPLVQSPFAAANRNANSPLTPTVVVSGGGGGFSVSGVRSVVHASGPSISTPLPFKTNEFIIRPQVSHNLLMAPPVPQPPQSLTTGRVTIFSDQVNPGPALILPQSPPEAPPAPPPSYYTSALADEIHCVRQPGKTSLTALLTAPPGYTALPFLNARPDIDAQSSETCRIVPTVGSHVYHLEIFDFPACGVSSQMEADSKEWLSVSIRFPLVSGLKTPDDEVITIKCKPQDRTASANHAVDFHGNLVSSPATSRSSVFLGQEHDLQCDLALFRKSAGSNEYSHRVNAGSAIELGQELQLRAVIKPGDGWNYVRLSDVIVYRVPSSFDANSKVQLLEASRRHTAKSLPGDSVDATVEFAHLVLGDGCRNPSYKAIAPSHPGTDPTNSLTVAFNFKAFMFQTMDEGEAVRITAKVTACVEQADCVQPVCKDNKNRRKRHDQNNHPNHPDSTSVHDNATKLSNTTTDFDRNLTVVVLTANRPEDHWLQRELLLLEVEKQKSCPTLLLSAVGLAIALGLILVIIAFYFICNCRKRRQQQRSNWSHTPNQRAARLWTSSTTDPFNVDDGSKVSKSFPGLSNELYSPTKKPFAPINNNFAVDPSPSADSPTPPQPSLKRADSILRSLQTFLAASMLSSLRPQAQSYVESKRENRECHSGCHCSKTKRCPSTKEDNRPKVINTDCASTKECLTDDEAVTPRLSTFRLTKSKDGTKSRRRGDKDPGNDNVFVTIV